MSAVKFFKTITKDQDLNAVQDNLVRTLNPVFNTPILDGIILSNIVLNVGFNDIEHKLGRKLVGWHIIRQRSFANLYDDQDNNPLPNKTLRLVTGNAVIVDLYVF
jgi:hypothetical protein